MAGAPRPLARGAWVVPAHHSPGKYTHRHTDYSYVCGSGAKRDEGSIIKTYQKRHYSYHKLLYQFFGLNDCAANMSKQHNCRQILFTCCLISCEMPTIVLNWQKKCFYTHYSILFSFTFSSVNICSTLVCDESYQGLLWVKQNVLIGV